MLEFLLIELFECLASTVTADEYGDLSDLIAETRIRSVLQPIMKYTRNTLGWTRTELDVAIATVAVQQGDAAIRREKLLKLIENLVQRAV